MKTQKIETAILKEKELAKGIEKVSYYDIENFINDANCYLKAIKENRMFCCIVSVSNSGMSRNMKFLSCEKGANGFFYRNYFGLFNALGYREAKNKDAFATLHFSACKFR